MTVITDQLCPQCGAGLYRKPACCGLRRKGWRTVLACTRPGCGYKRGESRR